MWILFPLFAIHQLPEALIVKWQTPIGRKKKESYVVVAAFFEYMNPSLICMKEKDGGGREYGRERERKLPNINIISKIEIPKMPLSNFNSYTFIQQFPYLSKLVPMITALYLYD